MRVFNTYSLSALAAIMFLPLTKAEAFHELGISASIQQGIGKVQTMAEEYSTEMEKSVQDAYDKATRGGQDGDPEGQKLGSKIKNAALTQGKNALDNGISAVKSGNFNPQDIAGSMLAGAKPDLSNLDMSELASVGKDLLKGKKEAQKELANFEAELKALDEAEEQERRDKIKAIEGAIIEKELALTVATPGSDEALQFTLDLEDLKEQKRLIEEEIENEDEDGVAADEDANTDKEKPSMKEKIKNTAEKLKKKKDAIAEKYAEMKIAALDKMSAAQEKYQQYADALKEVDVASKLHNEVDKVTDKLFGNEEEAETETLYTQIIQDFFLGEDEEATSVNVSRIRQNRKRAYYQAVQDLFATAVQADGATWQAAQDANKMHATISEEAETNFGAKVMQLGVDIQAVKSAARFTRMLLAQMRMETTEYIQSWTSYDKMKDYSQDVTLFNLDNYIFDSSLGGRLKTKGNELFKKARNSVANQGKQAAQGLQSQLGQKLGQ